MVAQRDDSTPLHIVIIDETPADQLSRIAQVGQHLEVHYIHDLVVKEYRLQRDRPPGSEAELGQTKGQVEALLAQAEVLLGYPRSYGGARSRLQQAATPRLRWLQTTAAGLDQLESTGIFERPVTITTGKGLRSLAMAEYVVWAMLTLNQDMWERFHHQSQRLWQRRVEPMRRLQGQTLGIVGLGSVGGAAARLAKALGMRVIATKRSVTQRARNVDGVDEIFPKEELATLLTQSDYVLLSMPLTRETRRMIAEKELRAMKPTACLINVARGGVIDQDVLIRALKEGWIKGAVLDVFTPEPLPPESELWGLPNAIVTPHVSAWAGDVTEAATELFYQNLKRYLAGEPLLNMYDRALGY